MAVLAPSRLPGVGGRGARKPGPWHFVRLKVRLLRNNRFGAARALAFALSILFGLLCGVFGLFGLSATAAASVGVARLVAVLVGGATMLGWALFPLLFFGVDETLDPARFALLPLRRRTLVGGMFLAAFVGVPAAATLLALSGLVVSAGLRSGPLAALVALVGVVAGLCLGIVASRAVTSAFAALLRSRRVRDLAVVVIALLASSIGPLQLAIQALVVRGDVVQATRIGDVLAWTPLGAPYAMPFDVASGRWIDAGARLAITVGAIGLLLWWWSRTVESAMLATASGGGSARTRPVRGGAVATLVPRAVRGLIRPSASGAIIAGEMRFWWRDPRRRAGMASILMSTVVLSLVLNVAARPGPDVPAVLPSLTFSFVVSMAGVLSGLLLANQFAYDGNAYAAHMLAQVPGRVELAARVVAIAIVTGPVQIAVVVAVSVLTRSVDQLPLGLGMLAGAFGVSVATAGVLSIVGAYPLPESANPFALNTGGAGAKSLLAFVSLFGTMVLCLPVILAALFLSGNAAGPWLMLLGGILYGGGAAWLGTVIAGDLLDRRGPELLAAVTPRR